MVHGVFNIATTSLVRILGVNLCVDAVTMATWRLGINGVAAFLLVCDAVTAIQD